MLPAHANIDREIYSCGADVSSNVGSVTLAVDPGEGIIVKEQVLLSDGRLVSGMGILPTVPQRKPPSRTYVVIRSKSKLSLQREPEHESRTHAAQPQLSYGRSRVGFTKLK